LLILILHWNNKEIYSIDT